MTMRVTRFLYPAIIIGLAFALAFGVFKLISPKHNSHDFEAVAPNIERLAISPVIVIGTVVDEGKGVNLRRNSQNPKEEDPQVVMPGTEYKVKVTKVLKGDLQADDEIYVSVQGGSYKGKSEPIKSSVGKEKSYVFFLFNAAQGKPYYFDGIQPNIFEIKDNKMKIVTNVSKYKDSFEDQALSQSEFFAKLDQALKLPR